MKTKYIAVTAVAVILGGLAWFSDAPAPAQAGLQTKLERQALATDGLTLDVPDHDPQIEESDAIASARSAYGGLIFGDWDVSVEYHLVTSSHVTNLKGNRTLDRTPAYIVTFTRTSPPSVSSARVVHVIVDARSGEALQAFSNK